MVPALGQRPERSVGIEVFRSVAVGEEGPDGVGCDAGGGGVGDFEVVFLFFFVLKVVRRCLLLLSVCFLCGCGYNAFSEARLGSLLEELGRAVAHDGGV